MDKPNIIEEPPRMLVEMQILEYDTPIGKIYCTISDYDRVSLALFRLCQLYRFPNHFQIKGGRYEKK